jgi:hypothetical protein
MYNLGLAGALETARLERPVLLHMMRKRNYRDTLLFPELELPNYRDTLLFPELELPSRRRSPCSGAMRITEPVHLIVRSAPACRQPGYAGLRRAEAWSAPIPTQDTPAQAGEAHRC